MALPPPPRHPQANRPLAAGLTGVVLAGVLAALVYGFAPDLPRQIARAALTAINLDPPKPRPSPPPPAHKDAGASGAAGKRAVAAPVKAEARVAVMPVVAPTVASTGVAAQSGALAAGAGSGAAGSGMGTGSGAGGSGGGAGRKAEKIAGEIADKDYPKAGRALRLGHSVTVVLTIGSDGRVSDCLVRDPGPDPEADAITCRLIRQRFRYRPATNALGQPVESRTGWRQSWFY
jgi:protein TonB